MKPEILSIKLGYNPNSSAMALALRIFFYQGIVISVIFATVGFMLNFKKKKPACESESQTAPQT